MTYVTILVMSPSEIQLFNWLRHPSSPLGVDTKHMEQSLREESFKTRRRGERGRGDWTGPQLGMARPGKDRLSGPCHLKQPSATFLFCSFQGPLEGAWRPRGHRA